MGRRSLRFRRRIEVRRTVRSGRSFESALGRVVWLRVVSPQESRVLFVVSTKVSKRSTARNRIRRQLSEALRRFWRQRLFPVAAVIFVHPPVAAMPSRERNALAVELAERLAALTGRR